MLAFLILTYTSCKQGEISKGNKIYYISSLNGSDSASGLSTLEAWRSIERLEEQELLPGDTVKFEYGSGFNGSLIIRDSGSPLRHIVLTYYNYDPDINPPSFTNRVFDPDTGEYGNCIRLKGEYIVVDGLYFHNTVAEISGRIGFELMWELGAVYIDKKAQNCIVRNNEFFDCGVGIKSYGKNALILNNYLHDCNRILKKWSWGPLAIWLGGDYQEVAFNHIENYKAIDSRISWGPDSYGGGADGGAIEIDDARYPKSNIYIHHNYSVDNQGFIEVTWTDVRQNPPYSDFEIHHNISDDFQQFIALWCGKGCKIDYNTIIRRRRNVNDWGVFNITEYNSMNYIRNNIVVTENDIVIFNVGMNEDAVPNSIIENNLYYAVAGKLIPGFEGPGINSIFSDPLFVDIDHYDYKTGYKLMHSSPCLNSAIDLEYEFSSFMESFPDYNKVNLGAF